MSLLARHCVCSAVEFLRKSDSPRTKEGKRWRNIWRKKKKKIRKWLTNPKVPVFCKDSDVEAAVLLWLNTLTLCVTAENGTVNQNIYITNGPIGGPFHMMFEPSCLHWFFLPCRCFFTVSQKKKKNNLQLENWTKRHRTELQAETMSPTPSPEFPSVLDVVSSGKLDDLSALHYG